MQNPLADWINRRFPTRPSLPRSIELKAGDHMYIVLYDDKHLTRAEMVATQKRLAVQEIRTIFIGCDDPTQNMTYLEVEVPGPQAPVGERPNQDHS